MDECIDRPQHGRDGYAPWAWRARGAADRPARRTLPRSAAAARFARRHARAVLLLRQLPAAPGQRVACLRFELLDLRRRIDGLAGRGAGRRLFRLARLRDLFQRFLLRDAEQLRQPSGAVVALDLVDPAGQRPGFLEQLFRRPGLRAELHVVAFIGCP